MEPVWLHLSHNKQTAGNIKQQRNICSVSVLWQDIRDFKHDHKAAYFDEKCRRKAINVNS